MNLISPHLITQITIATFIYFFLFDLEILEMGYFSSTPKYLIVSLFTISHFLVDDFSKYIVHRFMHQWRFLWAFHKVHHSATNLTPITVFRTHPVEGLLFTLRSAIAQVLIFALFIFLFRDGVDLYTILGANIFVFFLIFLVQTCVTLISVFDIGNGWNISSSHLLSIIFITLLQKNIIIKILEQLWLFGIDFWIITPFRKYSKLSLGSKR